MFLSSTNEENINYKIIFFQMFSCLKTYSICLSSYVQKRRLFCCASAVAANSICCRLFLLDDMDGINPRIYYSKKYIRAQKAKHSLESFTSDLQIDSEAFYCFLHLLYTGLYWKDRNEGRAGACIASSARRRLS